MKKFISIPVLLLIALSAFCQTPQNIIAKKLTVKQTRASALTTDSVLVKKANGEIGARAQSDISGGGGAVDTVNTIATKSNIATSTRQITYYDSLTMTKIIDGDIAGFQAAFVTAVRMSNDSIGVGGWRGYNHSQRGLPWFMIVSPDGVKNNALTLIETDSVRNYTNFAVSNLHDTLIAFYSDGINGHCFKRISFNGGRAWSKDSINLAMGINIYVVGSGTFFKGNNIVPIYTITLPAGSVVRSGVMWTNNLTSNVWDTAWFPTDVALQLSEGSTPILENNGDSLAIFVRSSTNPNALYKTKSFTGTSWKVPVATSISDFLQSKPEVAKMPDGRYLLNGRTSISPFHGVVWISDNAGLTWVKKYEQNRVYWAYGAWVYAGEDMWFNYNAAQRSNGFGDIYKDVYSIARPSITQGTTSTSIEKQGAPFSLIREMTNREVYNAYSPGTALYSQRYGATSLAGDGQYNTALGHNAIVPNGFSQTTILGSSNTNIGNLGTFVGAQINANTGAYSTIVGSLITAYGNYNTYVGRSITGTNYTAVGYGITNGVGMFGANISASSFSNVFMFATNQTATADRQLIFGGGSAGSWPVDVYVGPPGGSANANNYGVLSLRGTNGLGTDIAGQGVSVKVGAGTGAGASGDFSVWTAPTGTSGATLNTLAQRMTIIGSGNVGLGTTSPTSTLHVVGSVAAAITSTSTDITLSISHYTVKVDASGANRTITLPAASGCSGRIYVIKKTDSSANTVTVDGNASETIDGATTYVLLTQYKYVTIQCDGSNWSVTGNN